MFALAAVLVAPALSQPAPAEDLPGRVGRVADLAGELFLAPQDKPDQWQPVGVNYPVAGGDNVWVGREGRAEIDFGAGQFRLAGDSNIHLSRLDDRQFAVFVAQGRVQVRVRVLDPGETARVDTPNAQIVITRAGAYRVDVSEDREHTLLVVREGEANVLTMGAVQQVLPGQTAYVDGMDPQFADVRNGVGTDGFDTWAASRDRLYLRGQYSSYVSPQMVGAADLDRYGTWSQVPEYGNVWYPNDVGPDWAPYRDGYWTDVGVWGPTWVDAAPWGYAPFHYGRWAFVSGRWGWCPGRYVARPLWAPALVAWTGGPGWSFSVSSGPVYGWVPLGWGEPYRPWWNRCSYGCWDRYNKPYAVNTAVYRPNGPPPSRYVNWNAPNGVTAVSGNSLVMNRPVNRDLVRVPREALSAAPVLATAPVMRQEFGRTASRRPEGTPPPASTVYPTSRPASYAPGGSPSGNAQMQRPGRSPQSATSGTFPSNATSPTTPAMRPAPGSSPPVNVGRPSPTSPSNTFARQPGNVPAAGPAPVATPSSGMQRPSPTAPSGTASAGTMPPLSKTPAPSVQPNAMPQDARPGRGSAQVSPVPTDPGSRSPSRSSQGMPLPPSMQPAPQPAPAMRPMPQQVPQHVAPAPQAPLSRSPAPSVVPSPPQQPAAVAPQPRSAAPPAPAQSNPGNDNNLRREDRGGGGGGGGQDRPGR